MIKVEKKYSNLPQSPNNVPESLIDQNAKATLKTIIDNSAKYFFAPIGRGLRVIFNFICITAGYIYKAETWFTSEILPELVEPVNYASLILRKCYTNSQTAIITMTALFFVVFYFILSIF